MRAAIPLALLLVGPWIVGCPSQVHDDDGLDDDSAPGDDDDDDATADDDTTDDDGWPEYPTNPYSFDLAQPVPGDRGGLFVHDLDGDGLMDFVVTGETHAGAYDHMGTPLWTSDVGIYTAGQYPGLHHPGAIAGDLDGDGQQEVAYLTASQDLRVVDGVTGTEEALIPFPGAQAVAIADLRGVGDQDAILQYSQTELTAIRVDTGETLWQTADYISVEHSPLRQADLDGDGLDEVAGLTFIDHDGSLMNAWNLSDHGTNLWSVDSVAIADVLPGGDLEAALAEQGGNNEAILANADLLVFHEDNPDNPCCEVAGECLERDCDKVALGEMTTDHGGLELFCRSACGRAPWVFNADGEIIAQWVVDDTSPESWYIDGIEEVATLDWDGDGLHEIVAKERHAVEDAAIIAPLTGEFLQILPAAAERVYAVDIAGDPREEVVVLDAGGAVLVFGNDEPSTGALGPRRWAEQAYRRQKQNWNYYSP